MSRQDLNPTDDTELLSLIARHNESAFRELYERYFQKLFNLVLFYLKNSQMAEDVVQEVFITIWEKRTELHIQENPSAYIHAITRNLTLRTIVKRNREVTEGYEFETRHYLYQQEVLVKINMEKNIDELYKAIQLLPPNKREICLLKLSERLSNEEIADRMGLSIDTIKSHFRQSKHFLRFHLREKIICLSPYLILLVNRIINR